MTKRQSNRVALLFAVAVALILPVFGVTASAASADPAWRIDTLATTTAAQGDSLRYIVQMTNDGNVPSEATADPWTLTVTLPPGLGAAAAGGLLLVGQGWECPDLSASPPSFTCVNSSASLDPHGFTTLFVEAAVEASAGVLTSQFEISGGSAAVASTVDPTTITPDLPAFGVDAFDGQTTADAAGTPQTRAGAHPYSVSTSIDFNTAPNSEPMKGSPWPIEPAKDIVVDLPQGSFGDPSGLAQCDFSDLSNSAGTSVKALCPPASQVGTTLVRTNRAELFLNTFNVLLSGSLGPVPVFNLRPPPDVPARLGFNVAGTIVTIDAHVRSDSDYGVTATVRAVPEGLALAGTDLTLWGVPASPAHDLERACAGQRAPWENGPSCQSGGALKAFWRNPTSCTPPGVGLKTTLRTDSWVHPGDFKEASFVSHDPPGYPYPPSDWGPQSGITGCEKVPFKPSIDLQPASRAAGSPTALSVDLSIPQTDAPNTIAQSDLRKAVVKLPPGVHVNASSAQGLQGCSPAQIGLHSLGDPTCPSGSKIGTVTVKTPVLADPLQGSIYLASQFDNPFDSLLAVYITAKGSGVQIKLAGQVETLPDGQVVTTFDDNPQAPFSSLHLEFNGGPRAPLALPSHCGTYTTEAQLTGWSGKVVNITSPFTVDQECAGGGFAPKLSAGAQRAIAGATSPFSLRLTRAGNEQQIASLTAKLPPGLTGYLKGIPYCPDAALASISGAAGTGAAQIASPGCPAASRLGTVTVGAGAGSNPFYTDQGRAYLAGPYKGAPLSLAVVAPAVAGPFDLGNVVVRNAIQVDPESAQLTVLSDPLPSVLFGIPLDLRDIRVDVDRSDFTLNPTSCEPMSVDATVRSTEGAVASPSNRFQVADCAALAFKPKLSLRLSGAVKRSGNPGLRAVLQIPQKGANANISSVAVSLPRSEFVAQDHLADVCTRVQYAAGGGGGAGCPAKSVYGHARAFSPLLGAPLEGPVYLRSNGGDRPLPDLVASLGGQIHLDLVGYVGTDKRTGGLKTTFATAPDAPVDKFILTMPAGRHSLLENSTNICRGTRRATVQMDAHNGMIHDFRPVLDVACRPGKQRHRR